MKTPTGPDPAAPAREVARDAARTYQAAFADRFVAGYALGSLAHGGYAPAVSDIDLAVVLAETRDGDDGTVAGILRTLHERAELYRRLSVFWGSLPALRQGRDDGRFPAVDRLDLAEHGVLLLGADVARQVAVPGAGELLVDSARFAVKVLATDEVVAEIHRPARLLRDPVWFTKAVLFPIRFFYSSAVATGRGATNDEAIAWYLARPEAVAAPLVRLAARVRAGEPLDPAEAGPLLATELAELYRQYAEDQARRLGQTGGADDLVTAFTRWRDRLDPS
ncbi:hypothetical protein O7626_09095 [Micromonospora sp. WMMD1102]|uniref:hypothetical protein n=1 Tax=Micromonospora sp. WMMD1102 TaxID=3016105 RepID=UPI0024156232|nr:hypothetical protein [Micromonospora sp. WMMD1102]MDG4786079.1 hypothetical protein [Micromonospora sp. WMMD1102]